MILRRSIAAISFLIAAVPALAEAPMKRLTLRQDLLGWEAIGRVDVGPSSYCTGVLIAPDLVLTAAHCLPDGAGPTGEMRFRAGLSDGTALAEAPVARAVAHPRYDRTERDLTKRVRYDAALLQLAVPVPLSVAAPFQVAGLAGGARDLSVVSYGQGRDEALSWDEDCGVVGRLPGLIAFDCDVTFGSSGAPVFHRAGGRASIVSLVSAGGMTELGRLAVGMELPPVVADLRSALRQASTAPRSGAVTGARRIAPSTGFGATGAGGAKVLRP